MGKHRWYRAEQMLESGRQAIQGTRIKEGREGGAKGDGGGGGGGVQPELGPLTKRLSLSLSLSLSLANLLRSHPPTVHSADQEVLPRV